MPETVAPGRVLGGRYRLDHELARGGMATVWVAEDPLLSRRVAVKILHAELAVDAALRRRFRHEAVSAARLTHPGIVATYDTGDDDGTAYIVMQLVEGPNLRRLLDERGPLPVGEAVEIASQVADALDHAHRHGLVHRDVKPANVLVPADRRVRVTDFGIAKAAGGEDLTRSGTVVGTARYLAPEQVNGETVDGRADVYALGLVLYESLSGRLPFTGDTELATALARLTVDPPPLRGTRPEIPPGLEGAVHRSLARDPTERFATAGALRDALVGSATGDDTLAVATAPPASPRTTTPGPEAAPTPRRRRARSLVLAVLLAAVGVGGGYLAVRALTGGGSGSGGSSADLTPIAVVGATDFDPEGDGVENRSDLPRVFDGDPLTVWSTERYENRDFDEPKRGVGIVLELESDLPSRALQLAADDREWNVEVYAATQPGAVLEDWGAPLAAREAQGTNALVELPGELPGPFLLVWITRLPADGKLGIGEVTVAG